MFGKERIRELVVLLGGILFLAMGVIFKETPFSEESVIAFALLLAGYFIGEGLEGERILENVKQLLLSSKFQMLVTGVAVLVVREFWPEFPLTDEQVLAVIGVLTSLILGSGMKAYKARAK